MTFAANGKRQIQVENFNVTLKRSRTSVIDKINQKLLILG